MAQAAWTVYVLELEHGKYYVGRTQRAVEQRLAEHRARGAGWLHAHRPLRVSMTFNNCDTFDENKVTKMVMALHGVDNVRGGAYCQMELSAEQHRLLEIEIASARDECYYCRQSGHFAADCPRTAQQEEEEQGRLCGVRWPELFLLVVFVFFLIVPAHENDM